MNRYLTRCQFPSADLMIRLQRRAGLPSAYYQAGAIALFSALLAVLSHLPVQSQETDPSPTPQPVAESNARPLLQLGSQGLAVTELQAVLKLLGYYAGAIDGVYQQSTADAVAAFQQVAGLQPDGVTGTETWDRLLPASPVLNQTATATSPTPAVSQAAVPPSATTPSNAPGANSAALQPAPSGLLAPTPTPAPAATSAASNFPTPTQTPASTSTAGPAPTPTPAPSPTPQTEGYTPATPSSTAANSTAPTSTPNSTATPANSNLPVLRLGMQGADVTRLQEQLKAVGLFTGAVDGVFGAETQAAVEEAQRRYNLEPDGVVGPATWAALFQGR